MEGTVIKTTKRFGDPTPLVERHQAALEAGHELVEINRELLEALETLLDVSDFAANSRVGEIHLRAMAVIQKAKAQQL
jgi:hypothetical protein